MVPLCLKQKRKVEDKMLTEKKLLELQAQVDDNMADAEVGPLLIYIAELRMQIAEQQPRAIAEMHRKEILNLEARADAAEVMRDRALQK